MLATGVANSHRQTPTGSSAARASGWWSLKTLSSAIRDGDAVHAVILGSAVRNDGSSGGAMMAPAVEGQVETLRAAYADAGMEPRDVGYVEAQGTGTPTGDPVEMAALARVLGGGRAARARWSRRYVPLLRASR